MTIVDVTLCMTLGDVTLCITLGDVLTLDDVEHMMSSDLTWQTLQEYTQRQCHNDSRDLSKLHNLRY